ncbi:hypothetical protein NPX13_g10113 [Xylaria arbuscula]|uniref:SigF-like NTF2-like domain-containing protein n=1 Tax=Xylaria arbuscula TaxID=114810 RepID=A0A9W8TI82_9PEZI|nr:hypothetical protein NPX13_g10113 [Xylaria arbuscula]
MDDPEREIKHVIKTLTEGTREEQQKTLNKYFLPDAFFVHPFCRVPSFKLSKLHVPFTNYQFEVESRSLILLIYQWYKIMSPKIELKVLSTSFDKQNGLLYATIRQTFTIWLVPFSLWQANVQLVCLLNLERLAVDINNQPLLDQSASYSGKQEKLYFIRGQQDHYQVNEFLKFIAPWGASPLYYLWQLFATLLSAIGVLFLWPVTSIYETYVVPRRNRQKTQNKDQECGDEDGVKVDDGPFPLAEANEELRQIFIPNHILAKQRKD